MPASAARWRSLLSATAVESDDRQTGQSQLAPNSLSRVVAIQHRHLEVHQHHVEGLRLGLQAFEGLWPLLRSQTWRALELGGCAW